MKITRLRFPEPCAAINFAESADLFGVIVGKRGSMQALQIYCAKTLKLVRAIDSMGDIRDFSLSHDGREVVIAASARSEGEYTKLPTTISRIDVKSGELVARREFMRDVRSIRHCGPDAALALGLVICDKSQPQENIQFWSEDFSEKIGELKTPNGDTPFKFAYSLERDILAVAGCGAHIWDLSTRTLRWDDTEPWSEIAAGMNLDIWEASDIAISKDGGSVAVAYSGSGDGPRTEKVLIYSVLQKSVLGWYCDGSNAVDSVAISPDGEFVAGVGGSPMSADWFNPRVQIVNVRTRSIASEFGIDSKALISFMPTGAELLVCEVG